MAGINLPGGYSFDPATGEISGNGIPRSTSSGGSSRASTRANTSRSYYRSNLSLWDRIDNFIIGIGNWIASNGENAMMRLSMILWGLSWVGFAIGIIAIWIDEGFIWALIAGIIGGGVFYFVSGLALALFFFIDDFILLIVRYIFYNIWTFLIALGILCGSIFLNNADSFLAFDRDTVVEEVYEQPVTSNIYYCTASSVLNVRSAPRKDAYVVGSLKPGQEVQVHNFVDGFAKISYNGTIAYASSAYLKKK